MVWCVPGRGTGLGARRHTDQRPSQGNGQVRQGGRQAAVRRQATKTLGTAKDNPEYVRVMAGHGRCVAVGSACMVKCLQKEASSNGTG